jgi:hypothetical protein
VRGKDQRLMAGTGVVGVEEERGRGGVTAANTGGWRSSEGVDGVPVARVQSAAVKWSESFYVMMWCCARPGLGGGGSAG